MNQIKNIYEEGEGIFPINEDSQKTDKECDNLYNIENWAETIYHLKTGKSKERFIELLKNYEYSPFLEGLNYEYGINGYKKDLQKAFKIFKDAANNTTDSMSMFRLYHLYKKDYAKFNFTKRNRILEKYYLFKCFAFLRFPLIERDQRLFNRFDITYEIMIHFENEDEDFSKFHELIKFLNLNYKLYDINPKDLIIIESMIDYKLNIEPEERKRAITTLTQAANEDNLEAFYKFTCLQKEKNEVETEKRFKILVDKKYYRSYVDYALYLNSKKRYKEALDILKIARKNGIIPAEYIYYDIFLEYIDFSELMREAIYSSFSKECELYNLFEILIDDIITENVYSIFEFIVLRKICVKHFGLEPQINSYFIGFTKELIDFLKKITGEKNELKKKAILKKYFCRNDNYEEFHLAYGTLLFYGIKNLIKIDNRQSLNNFIISYKASESNSYKRFCYYYIYRLRKRLNEESKIKMLTGGITNFITDNEIQNTEKFIFKKYYDSINESISDLSSSYFYYLSRLLHKKIGNNGDKILEYICINKSSEYKNQFPGSGSIISIYRKYKSILLKKKYEAKANEEFKKIIKGNDSEGYGEDGSICPICFEYKRNTISLPCKHLFCEYCITKLEKCPICRRSILMKHFIV